MRRLVPILLAMLVLPAWYSAGPAPLPLPGPAAAQDFQPRPFHDLAERVADRYRGRLIGAEVVPPTAHERDLGAPLVYEFRLVTPQRNLLIIRMDARSGRFLDIAGRGQLQALRRDVDHRHDDDRDKDDDED
ncbi:PepSY domain-containing protein [Paracoccus marinaquae]|uniref:PepSY domain-containing protein n=1 Tax=Paracoccus marinaquae TaxID=2841926 RepID=A0ABS6AP03_9RHOB|nr:hypothetical protein [Paracoccus marinaquae]MBU3032224.1 hypothetical protein [Paracoccus marinaquae]